MGEEESPAGYEVGVKEGDSWVDVVETTMDVCIQRQTTKRYPAKRFRCGQVKNDRQMSRRNSHDRYATLSTGDSSLGAPANVPADSSLCVLKTSPPKSPFLGAGARTGTAFSGDGGGVAIRCGGSVSGKRVLYRDPSAHGMRNSAEDEPAGWNSGKTWVRGVEGASGAVSFERRWNQRVRLEEHWSAKDRSSEEDEEGTDGQGSEGKLGKRQEERATERTWHDDRCRVEQGRHEQILEGDLTLGLDSGVRVLDDRDREGEADLERRLVVPLVQQRRRPVLGDLDRTSLRGNKHAMSAPVPIEDMRRDSSDVILTGLLMSAHFINAWRIINRSFPACLSLAPIVGLATTLSDPIPSGPPWTNRSPISVRLPIHEKCIDMSVARIVPNRSFLKSTNAARATWADGLGAGTGLDGVAVKSMESAGSEVDPKSQPKPCFLRRLTTRMQCRCSSADLSSYTWERGAFEFFCMNARSGWENGSTPYRAM